MCGRYTLTSPGELIAELFALDATPELAPRYNIAPTQETAAVRVLSADDAGDAGDAAAAGRRTLDLLRWGLVPFWARDPGIGNRMINARSETAAAKPAFRNSFKKRRCLVVADGFYEWQKTADGKLPHRIRREDRKPFAFAGLWDRWRDDQGELLDTFTILTAAAAPAIEDIHDRMPVILDPAAWERWLDPGESDRRTLEALLVPDAGGLEAYAVSRVVNNPRNDVPECIEAV